MATTIFDDEKHLIYMIRTVGDYDAIVGWLLDCTDKELFDLWHIINEEYSKRFREIGS